MTLLRAARPTDAGKVGGILTAFSATTPWMPVLHTGAEDIAHAGRLIDRGWVNVAEFEGQVVGFSACDGSDLDALYVLDGFRGQGVGSALLGNLQTTAKSLLLWTFVANTQAQVFYLKHGFSEVGRSDGARNDEKLPDIQFQWEATP